MNEVGLDVIGADEMEEIMTELGIQGDEVVGAKKARQLAQRVAQRFIVPNSAQGRGRQFPFGFTPATVADTAAGTLTGTPDRRSVLRALHVQANSVLGVLLYGLSVTTITVQGRNARVGSGSIPDFALRTWALTPMHALNIGVCESNATVSVGVLNECGATVDCYGSCLAETTD